MSLQLLESCTRSRSLTLGKIVHQQLLKRSLGSDNVHALEKLTRFYVSCNDVKLARHVFDQIPLPDVVFWDLMIKAYAWNGPMDQALELYYGMMAKGIEPSKYTYSYVLKACSGLRAIRDGSLIHDHVRRRDLFSDVYVSTSLFDFYAKCGDLEKAMEVFRSMTHRDVIAWNASISGFSHHGDYDNAVRLFIDMQNLDGFRPNSSTIVGLLPVLARSDALMEGKGVQGFCIRNGFSDDVGVQTGILDVYAKCKCIGSARKMFDMIRSKNEVTCTAMISGYVDRNMMEEAMDLFRNILSDNDVRVQTAVAVGLVLRGCANLGNLNGGRCLHCYSIKKGFLLDLTAGNTLISFYAKCGIITEARKYFNEMGPKDTVSYNVIISGCIDNGKAEEVFGLFREMKILGVTRDFTTMMGIITACTSLSDSKHGSCCHGCCIVGGFAVDTSVCNALINMYSKCGQARAAREVFDKMHIRDTVSWNTMILCYGIHGLGKDALSLFNDMQSVGAEPDDVTFLSLLSACNYAGLVYEGTQVFDSMTRDFGIVPMIDHTICMTDLLGRAGFLDEAYGFIKETGFDSDIQLWITLLGACRTHNNVALGDEVTKKIESLGCKETGGFILLSNVYSGAERWQDAANIRRMQKILGFEKSPGCSWVEVNGNFQTYAKGYQFNSVWS